MSTAICTLFEGHYHYGVGALANSLYHYGFRGVLWVGYRGQLPPWVKELKKFENYTSFQVTEDFTIRFVELSTHYHFTNYKPHFMLMLWKDYCPEIEKLFYFDPDIIINHRWPFYESWVNHGIALCQNNVDAFMPKDHPSRLAWIEFVSKHGYEVARELNQYFNGGFIGVNKLHQSALNLWRDLTELSTEAGLDLSSGAMSERSQLFAGIDQDLLNLTAMLTPHPLSTIGPEGMGFDYGSVIMYHAVGSPKPWRKRMIENAFKGHKVSIADKKFWSLTQAPIQTCSHMQLYCKQTEISLSILVSRLIG